ncbi:MAG: FMN-binding negative transcriptional regulator [Piscinibacter sp.]|uniref:FMN-binding negative transcriptional regulator n=1 Tax=Piscinibacter sp. TaxID=1903157 RepID=UPI003D0EBA5D
MYLPTHFEESRTEVMHTLLRAHPLGLLVTLSGGELQANSIPFMLDAQRGPHGTLVAHVARANPLWREAALTPVLAVFQGPQAYISPSGYAAKAEHGKVVPTWNYVMVQARGRLRAIEDARELHALVSRLTNTHEAGRAAPWAVSDAPDDYIEKMLGAIVGIEIPIESLTGKWKVSQNRSAADRDGVARMLEQEPGGAAMAAQVRNPGAAPA